MDNSKTMRTLLLFFLCFSQIYALACSCAPPPRLTEADVLQTGVVFIGKIESVQASEDGFQKVAQFQILESFVTAKKQKTIRIQTPNNSAACGLYFEPGVIWYIWAQEIEPGLFYSNICSRSQQLDGKNEIKPGSRVEHEINIFKQLKKKKGTQTFNIPKGLTTFKGGKATGKLCKGLPKGSWTLYDKHGQAQQVCIFDRKMNKRTCSELQKQD